MTEPWSLGQITKGRRNYHWPAYIREQEDSRQDHRGKQLTLNLQSNLPRVWYRKFGTCTEKVGRRWANRSRPRELTLITKKQQRKMPQARGDSLLQITQNRQTHHLPERVGNWTCPHYQWICHEWTQLFSFVQRILRTGEFWIFEITSNSCRSCQNWTSDWN